MGSFDSNFAVAFRLDTVTLNRLFDPCLASSGYNYLDCLAYHRKKTLALFLHLVRLLEFAKEFIRKITEMIRRAFIHGGKYNSFGRSTEC
jgi:hypothetical protein